jgi:hypothetical protein
VPIACYIPKATDTHIKYVIITALLLPTAAVYSFLSNEERIYSLKEKTVGSKWPNVACKYTYRCGAVIQLPQHVTAYLLLN